MIHDTISNAKRYAALHPDFAQAIELLQTLDFANLPDGQYPIDNPNIRLFIGSEPMRTREEAKPEMHITLIYKCRLVVRKNTVGLTKAA